MAKTGINNTLLKQRNRGLVLRLIATGECSSRIEIAQKTGLAKMTVTYIVNEFLEQGVLEERQKVQVEGKGRNPVQLCISSQAPKLVGVHLYRERCTCILCDMQLNILKKSSFAIGETDADQLLQDIFAAIDEVMAAAENERIYGVGIGAIGPVDIEKGMILSPPNFHGIHDLALKTAVENRYQLPVFFDGESNGAAITEKYYGSGRDCEDFIYVDLANGVGVGLVSNGSLYKNTSGMVCELGHISIDWQGEPCGCGSRGCLERYISSNVIEKKLQQVTGEKEKSFAEFGQEMEQVLADGQLTEKEKQMDTIFTDMAQKMACGVVSFCNGLNPQKIIIGHEGYWIPDAYLEQTEKIVNDRQIARDYRKVKLVKSGFGADATVYGCTGALLTALFDGDLF